MFVIPVKQVEVSSHCLGPGCGKGIVGGLDVGGLPCIPCRQAPADCPVLREDIPTDLEYDGERVTIRLIGGRHG